LVNFIFARKLVSVSEKFFGPLAKYLKFRALVLLFMSSFGIIYFLIRIAMILFSVEQYIAQSIFFDAAGLIMILLSLYFGFKAIKSMEELKKDVYIGD